MQDEGKASAPGEDVQELLRIRTEMADALQIVDDALAALMAAD